MRTEMEMAKGSATDDDKDDDNNDEDNDADEEAAVSFSSPDSILAPLSSIVLVAVRVVRVVAAGVTETVSSAVVWAGGSRGTFSMFSVDGDGVSLEGVRSVRRQCMFVRLIGAVPDDSGWPYICHIHMYVRASYG